MAFRTDTPLSSGLERSLAVAKQTKYTLQDWQIRLQGDITALDAVQLSQDLRTARGVLQAVAAIPGMAAYAQDQYDDTTYDVAAEFNAMLSAITAVIDWLGANIPSNSITIVNGAAVGDSYTPAQTAGLLSLINAAAATIDG